MKFGHLTPRNQKWALTVALMAVLGFNLSAPLKKNTSGSIHLAQTAVPDPNVEKPKTVEVVPRMVMRPDQRTYVKVKFVEVSEKVTLAITEGRANCTSGDCLGKTYTLNANIKEIEALEREFNKVDADNKVTAAPKADDEEDSDLEEAKKGRQYKKDSVEEKQRAALDRIAKICDRGSRETRGEAKRKATCYTRYYTDILKNFRHQGKKINEDVALDYFNDELRPLLRELLTSEGIADSAKGIVLTGSSEGKTGTELIRRLQAGLPSGFRDVRAAVADLSKEVLQEYVQQVQLGQNNAKAYADRAKTYEQMADQAKASGNIAQENAYRQQAMAQRNLAMKYNWQATQDFGQVQNFIAKSLLNENTLGLASATKNGLIQQTAMDQILSNLQQAQTEILTSFTPSNDLGGGVGGPNANPNLQVGPGGQINVTNPNGRGVIMPMGGSQMATPTPFAPGNSPMMNRQQQRGAFQRYGN